MGRKRYYFPYVAKGDPKFHLAVTSKTLMERVDEIVDVFKKYDENSNSQFPKQILFLMSQQNESLFELSECAKTSVSKSTSPEVKSSPESSSPGKRNPSASSLKQKQSFGDSVKSGNLKTASSSGPESVFVSPPKKGSSPTSRATDLIPTSRVQHQEFSSTETPSLSTAERKLASSIKLSKNDANITSCDQENVSPIDKAKVEKKSDCESPEKIPEMPAIPFKDEKYVRKPAKRPAILFHSNLADIPEFGNPAKKVKTLIAAAEDDKMDISPKKGDEMCDSPNRDHSVIALSPDKSGSSQKIESIYSSVPIVKDGGFEIDMSSKPNENPGPSCAVSSEEIEDLADDPSRVESLRKAVEDRLNVFSSPKKTKGDFSPSEKKSSNLSPRKSTRINSPGKYITKTTSPDPNVMKYLKLRFKSVLSHRNECMGQINNFLKEFKSDVDFLNSYSRVIQLTVPDIPIEVHFTRDLRKLRDNLVRNARELCNHLSPMKNTLKVDIPLWAQDLNEIQKLNEKNEHFLSEESDSQTYVEFLREYESNLRVIWERLDRRVLLGDGMRLAVLEISSKYIKLTKDFAKFLIMVEMMKPSSIASSEAEEKRLKISWC